MIHDQLKTIIDRYTPTLLKVVAPASTDEIARLEASAGPLPETYRDFLGWMGNRCPFLDGEELAYSPEDLLELAYEDPEIKLAEGFILIGIDKSGTRSSVYIRRQDAAVVRLSEYDEAVNNEDLLIENASLASFLLTAYLRKTLVPSHPYHFAAALKGDAAQIQDIGRRVDEACGRFPIPFPIDLPDFRLYGGNDFVIGMHYRPKSSVLHLHFGAVERSRYEAWTDLVFDQWHSMRMSI